MEWQVVVMNTGTLLEIIAYVLIACRKPCGWVCLLIVAGMYGAVQFSWWGFESMTVFVYPINAVICITAWYVWKCVKYYDDLVGDFPK